MGERFRARFKNLFRRSPAGLPLGLILLLWTVPVLAAATIDTPVVPVRLSWVVADFRWNHDPAQPAAAGLLDGAVMDNSDALRLSQEIMLPGIIWKDARRIVIGVQWYWADLKNASVRLDALPPQAKPVRLTPVGFDEGFGLLVLEPVDTNADSAWRGIRIPRQNLAEDDPGHRLVCSPEGSALRFWAATVRPQDRLQPMSSAFLEPLLAPVLTPAGDFDGFTFPLPGLDPAGRVWKHLPAGEIAKRVDFIARNRQDLTAGYLGVFFGDPEAAASSGPAVVRQVVPGSPAAIAGLKRGDVIRKIGRQPVGSLPEAISVIQQHPPNSRVEMELLRNGALVAKQVILAQKPARPVRQAQAAPPVFDEPEDSYVTSLSRYATSRESRSDQAIPTMGTFIRPVSAELLRRFGGSGDSGVLVAMVLPGYPAEQAGLRAGDVLLEIQGRPVKAVPDVNEILKSCQKSQAVKVRYLRGGQSRLAELVLR